MKKRNRQCETKTKIANVVESIQISIAKYPEQEVLNRGRIKESPTKTQHRQKRKIKETLERFKSIAA
jgi:hypothetical protein